MQIVAERTGQDETPPFWRAVSDLFFPPFCLGCNSHLASSLPPLFCPSCAQTIAFVEPPLCPICGRGFPNSTNGDHLCSGCLSEKRHYDRARALLYFTGATKTAVHAFKYNGSSACIESFKKLAHTVNLSVVLNGVDIITPVPLHFQRLQERGFNQALFLARAFFTAVGIPILPDLLVRSRQTVPQVLLSGHDRRRNLKNAFSTNTPVPLTGKTVLLVDDVYTTGTSVNECARVLKLSGAATVLVFTLARVYED